MVGIRGGAITDQFRDGGGASRHCVVIRFDHQDAGTFAHDKAVTMNIKWPGSAFWHIRERCAQRFDGGETAQADFVNTGFRTPTNRNISFIGVDQACSIAYRLPTPSCSPLRTAWAIAGKPPMPEAMMVAVRSLSCSFSGFQPA